MKRSVLELAVPSEEVQDRFWDKVDSTSEDGCWAWQAAVRPADGVGVFGLDGKILYAHRLAYVVSRGLIPEGFEVRRSCGNRLCVRPRHLLLKRRGDAVRPEDAPPEVSEPRPI